MKRKLLNIFTILICTIGFATTFAQVTQISNNTSLRTGVLVNGKIVFVSDNDSLWVSNATSAGTAKLSTPVSVIDSAGFAVYNGKLFFAGKNSTKGVELWATDGTTAGTVMVKDIRTGSSNSVPSSFFIFNNKLYFTANNGTNGKELWISNGTAAGTVMPKDIFAGVNGAFTNYTLFFAYNGVLYFAANNGTNGKELWKTNGTATGTVMVKDITSGAGSTEFTQMIGLGTSVLIATRISTGYDHQMALWKTNGTATGTTLIKNFGFYSGLFPPSFFPFKGKIHFVGTNFTTTGAELWVTDGTVANTKIVKDIHPGTESSMPFLFNAVIINGKFYFSATDAKGTELWMSDGTTGGTALVKDINVGMNSATPIIFKNYNSAGLSDTALFNGKIFFTATNGTNGKELWITNGTAAGTTLVKDIWVGKGSGQPDMLSYFYTKSGLYFVANDSTRGIEPWFTNGTSTGTKIVADINAGKKNANPQYVALYNSQLLLNANNGDNTVGKTDLYKVNTTVTALRQVEEITELGTPSKRLLSSAQIAIAPNPVQRQLTLRYKNSATSDIFVRIIDNYGRVVYLQNLKQANIVNQSFDVSSYPKGLYYIQLGTEGELKTLKFIKE